MITVISVKVYSLKEWKFAGIKRGVLGLSQKAYLEKDSKRYSMHASKLTPVL